VRASRKERLGRRPTTPHPASDPTPDTPALDRRTLAFGAGVVAVAAILYLLTAARDIVVGDTPEFIAVAFTLGVAHPSGYPVTTILGHLFSLLPLDPLPFRVNLLAVVSGAATIGLVYLAGLRLGASQAAAAAGAVVLAFSPLFWSWSLVAEAFPLNNLFAAALILLLIRWQLMPEDGRPLIIAAFVGGLALANHLTFILLGPAILFLLWRQRRSLLARPRGVAACVAATLLGLLPYAYLPWAAGGAPMLNWGGISSASDLLGHVLRQSYGTGQLVSDPVLQGGSAVERVAALFFSFTPLEGALVLLGAAAAWRRMRWYFWFSLLAFAFTGPAFAAYANINLSLGSTPFVLERFFLLPHVVVAPLMSLGVMFLGELLARLSRARPRLVEEIAAVAIVLASIGGAVVSYTALDQSGNHVARRFGEDILATLPRDSILIVGGDHAVLPVAYLQAVERSRPDVTLVMTPLLTADWYVRQLRARYPDLVIPFARHDANLGTMKSFVDANQGRTIALVGSLPDESLKGTYWFYRRGLVMQIEPIAKDVPLSAMAADNEQLINSYHPPSPDGIKARSFERGILSEYAAPAYRVGEEYQRAQRYSEARVWYQRALSIDPDLTAASEALATLPR
jgi:dolichyl-phosphate-mannose-protein mannosyltransferase